MTAQGDAEHRAENLRDRQERRRSGRSQGAPVERVWVEKEDGRQRPLGKPPCEAMMVQRAVARRLAAIDEPDCDDGSDGLRAGSSPP